jgi:hypothetical protein
MVRVGVALLALCLTSHARGEEVRESGLEIVGVRTDVAPSLDGTVDESWSSGVTVSRFVQREPNEGTLATEQTTVSVLYDRRYLYFGIRCFDATAGGIVATELRRDGDSTVDDSFTILLSPAADGRNAYTFTVTPLGTQFDSLLADEGQVDDPNWDGVWRSAATIGADGWSATVAIPFATLNFKTSKEVTLGLNFRRFIRRKNEESLWQSYLRIHGLNRISRSGRLTGLAEIDSGRLLIVKPYLLGGFDSPSGRESSVQHTGGVDLKYGIRSNLVANLTANTDFADVDVDPVRFNLTPFRISLPEKRPFFLENHGIFQFGSGDQSQLFFSRQIGIDPISGEEVPIDGGGKVTGSIGPYEVGLLDIYTRASGSNPSANYAVARVKRRLLAGSYVGMIGIDKESSDPRDRFNRAAGIDGSLRFFDRLTINGYYARTVSADPTLRGKDSTSFLAASYDSNLIQADVRHAVVQPHFNPEVGFVDRIDLVTDVVELLLLPRPKSGPIREFNVGGFYVRQPDTEGVLQTREWQVTFRAKLHNGAYTDDDIVDSQLQRLKTPFTIFKDVVIPPGVYRFDRHQVSLGSDQSRRVVLQALDRFGTFYNGRLNEAHVSITYHPQPRLAMAASEGWDHFRFSRIYDVHVGSLNSSYSLSRFLTASGLVQWNSVYPRPLSLSLRLRFNYRPDSDLFVVYTVGNQFGTLQAGNPVVTRGKRLAVKLTYSFLR